MINDYLPYVYKVTHKETRQFYIGMRSANKVVAEQDLGIFYFTSNKFIKNNFDYFEIEIIAYFQDQESAFNLENKLIEDSWNNPMLLNKHFQRSMSTFSMKGSSRPDLAHYNKIYKSKPKEFREYECVNCRDTFYNEEHLHIPRNDYCFCSKSCSAKYLAQVGKIGFKRKLIKCKNCDNLTMTSQVFCCDECKIQYKKNNPRVAWNKAIPNPQAAQNGKKGAIKSSITAKGRKIMTMPDGSRKWFYPEPIK